MLKMSVCGRDFKKDSDRALKNEKLQKALRYTTDRFRERRKSAVAAMDNWEDLKRR
jgi:L-lactate utilization protein LutB